MSIIYIQFTTRLLLPGSFGMYQSKSSSTASVRRLLPISSVYYAVNNNIYREQVVVKFYSKTYKDNKLKLS